MMTTTTSLARLLRSHRRHVTTFAAPISASLRRTVSHYAALPVIPMSEVYFPGEKDRVIFTEPQHQLALTHAETKLNSQFGIVFITPESEPEQARESADQLEASFRSANSPFSDAFDRHDSFQDNNLDGPGDTEWRASRVGCMAQIVRSAVDGDDLKVKYRILDRIRLSTVNRHTYGYWLSDVETFDDDVAAQDQQLQIQCLRESVENRLLEYAKLMLQGSPDRMKQFQARHEYMREQSNTALSMWVAAQLKVDLSESPDGQSSLQLMLETRSLYKRLQAQNTLLENKVFQAYLQTDSCLRKHVDLQKNHEQRLNMIRQALRRDARL